VGARVKVFYKGVPLKGPRRRGVRIGWQSKDGDFHEKGRPKTQARGVEQALKQHEKKEMDQSAAK